MENQDEQTDARDVVIDMGEIFSSLRIFFPTFILCAFIGAFIAYLCIESFIVPQYSSTTKIYVIANEQQEKTNIRVDDGVLQAGTLLTRDYEQIIESPEVTETVICNLNLKNTHGNQMTNHELTQKLKVTIPDDTRVVNITVTDEDPYRASDIANAIRKVSETRIQSIMDMKTVKTISEATIPMSPESPNTLLFVMIGGLAGLLASVIAAVVRYILKRTGWGEIKLKRSTISLGIIAAILMTICACTYVSKDRHGPEIKFPRTRLTYTDRTNIQQLKKGVTAVDNKDGDVSSTLRISFVIPNSDKTEVIVEYLAKDKSNNVTKSVRVYHYSGDKTPAPVNEPSTSQSQNSASASGEK